MCVQEIRELKKSVGSFFTDEDLTEEREKIEEEKEKKGGITFGRPSDYSYFVDWNKRLRGSSAAKCYKKDKLLQ